MALLVDNKITNDDLKNTYLIDLVGTFGTSANEVIPLINKAYNTLLAFIYANNHDISTDAEILLLLDDATKVDLFKYVQAQMISNMIEFGGSDPIDKYLEHTIRHRIKLTNRNGWQK